MPRTETQFLVPEQTQAEKDQYLVDCFHDAGLLDQIVEGDYSIVAGRKGSGKTALARYLEQKFSDYGLLRSSRISITSFSHARKTENQDAAIEDILLFILLRVAKDLFDNKILTQETNDYWTTLFRQQNLTSLSTFESFRTTSKKNKIGGGFSFFKGSLEETRQSTDITVTSEVIYSALIESLPELGSETAYLYFIDDIADYLDHSDKNGLLKDIEIVFEVLSRLDVYNTHCKDNKRCLRFVVCIRDDLYEYMTGSNVNKLKRNSILLTWNEESFASLLIRRLPHFAANREEALKEPISSIKTLFPDSIFQSRLSLFDTNRYATNFYAYMVAISFNRPRDFLAFCYALRERLSLKYAVNIGHIDAAETEYTDYFKGEIRDELDLAARIFSFDSDTEAVNRLIDTLAVRDDFNSTQLRNGLAPLLKEKTSLGRKKVEIFVYQLWMYGILGFKEHKKGLVNFKYILSSAALIPQKIEQYTYYLHRGLWWSAQKRREKRSDVR